MKTSAWEVYLNGEHIDTVFYDDNCDMEYVWHSLIEHDGYSPNIKVSRYVENPNSRNETILKERVEAFNKHDLKPRVGDYLLIKDENGNEVFDRFTQAYDNGIQAGGLGGSFYLAGDYISYSGGLTPSIPYSKLVDTGKKKQGFIWFFNNDEHKAHNAVHFKIYFRIYKLKD